MSTDPIGDAKHVERTGFAIDQNKTMFISQTLQPELPAHGGEPVQMNGIHETLNDLKYVTDAIRRRAEDLGDHPNSLVFWGLNSGVIHAIFVGVWGGKNEEKK